MLKFKNYFIKLKKNHLYFTSELLIINKKIDKIEIQFEGQ